MVLPQNLFRGNVKNYLKAWHIRFVEFETAIFGTRTIHSCHLIKPTSHLLVLTYFYVDFFNPQFTQKIYVLGSFAFASEREFAACTMLASGFFSITVRNLVKHRRVPCCVLYTITAIIMANILIGLGAKPSLERGLC